VGGQRDVPHQEKEVARDILEGTSFCKVQFTDVVQSLPYSTRFETLEGAEYFRVIHDQQVKVCRMCIEPGHILRECPDFKCRKCGKQGHYARECYRREQQEWRGGEGPHGDGATTAAEVAAEEGGAAEEAGSGAEGGNGEQQMKEDGEGDGMQL